MAKHTGKSNSRTQTPPWAEIGQECLAARMRVLSRAVTAIFDEHVRHHGVTVPQVNLLACVASFGEVRPGLVSKALHMDHTTTSRNVERMIQHGLLEYAPDTDGRARPIRVAKKGEQVLRQILPDWRTAQQEAKQFLGEATSQAVSTRVSQLWSRTESRPSS